MENPLTRAIVCPIVVGRTAELTALRLLIDRTRSGQGQVTLVCGEAGIGKSRLVAEAKAYAAAQNFLVLQGSCFQIAFSKDKPASAPCCLSSKTCIGATISAWNFSSLLHVSVLLSPFFY